MIKKIKCDCGHLAYHSAVKEINGKKLCQNCWRARKDAEGLYEIGCKYPETEVCPDREPQIIDMTINAERRTELLKKARCYQGYGECDNKKTRMNNLICILEQVLNNNPVTCPNEGCNCELTTVKTAATINIICPVHGLIVRAPVKAEDRSGV